MATASENSENGSEVKKEESGGAASAIKHQSALDKQMAFLSGGRHEGCPILSFTSNGLRLLEGDEEQWKELDITLNYFKSLLNSEEDSKGVVILIDCRKSSQMMVIKALIEKIASEEFPLHCQSLFLYKSSTLSQFSQISHYFSKNKPKLTTAEIKEKLKVISVRDKEELFQNIPSESLTEEFGGTLPYNHQQWIRNNVLYEKIKQLHEQILLKFPDVRDGLNDFEVPQNVKDAERLMTQHLKLKEYFVNFFAEVDVCIDELTSNLSEQSQDTAHSAAVAVTTMPSTTVLAYLNQTNEEIHEEQAEFEKFWAMHKSRLDHIMRTCHYKRTVEKVGHLIQGHIDDLTHTELVIGETLETALELGEKHEVFVSDCKERMDIHMKEIHDEQAELSKVPGGDDTKNQVLVQDLERVKQMVQSLTELYQELMKLCQQKRDLFIVAVKFYMAVRQCEQWCSSVKEFIEVQPLDEISPTRAGHLVEEADHIMKQMTQRQLNAMKEFANCLPEKQVKKLINKTISRCKNNREKLEQHKTKLLQLVALNYAPPTLPQEVNSEPQSEPDNTPQVNVCSGTGSPAKSIKSVGSSEPDSGNPLSWTAEYMDEESDPSVLRKREFVYKEVVSTEKDYIEDLKIILDSYYNEMVPENRIPLRLRGKRDTIFGNLEQIFKFHNETFLQQLELYVEHPERIGSCFIKHSSEFQLYSSYCQNRPNSEALLTESPECQSFFKEIQLRLAHQLPLNSYLIKPIQRITKYQLLLKDMIKCSAKTTKALCNLQTALNIMLQVLKNLNDSLHVVGLKGFPGALAEQGRLLVHDPFQVWEMTGYSRNLLSRSHERHVFLFERIIIFSKKKEEVTQQKHKEKKSDSYFYKSHLQLADIQLKEHVDDNPLAFVVSLHGQARMYKLQASSRNICEMWVSELRRLLSNQFGLLKDVVLQSGTLDRATADKFAKMSKASKGKVKLFPEEISDKDRYLEPKKSFSERFKFNILGAKKKPLQMTTANRDIPGRESPSTSITSSLGARQGVKVYTDDYALTSSSLASSVPLNRAHSQDDLLTAGSSLGEEEWSDDDEEMASGLDHFESLAPGVPCYYVAIAEYNPTEEDQGIPLKIDQEVELIGINQYGWWWVRATNYFTQETTEGWVPASYLKISPIP